MDTVRTTFPKPDAGVKLNDKPPIDIMAMWLFLGTTVSNLSEVDESGGSHRCFICLAFAVNVREPCPFDNERAKRTS